MNARRSEGQTLVLFALILTVLIGISALVVDIGFKYASERRYQAVADAAALAGAQDLVTRVPTKANQNRARRDALKAVVDELGPLDVGVPCLGAGSNPVVDYVNIKCSLNGGQFEVSIRTPSPNCVDCIPDRSVQVTVREPAHGVSFARLFGQTTWNLARTSVAGMTQGKSYALVTLRPPNFSGHSTTDANVGDLYLGGSNTRVNVLSGDVGVNTYVVTNSDSRVVLDPGFYIWHWDAGPVGLPDTWNRSSGDPLGMKLGSLIPEPIGYDYRDEYDDVTAPSVVDSVANCTAKTAGITFPVKTGDPAPSAAAGTLTCLTPGVHSDHPRTTIDTPTYLEPGAHVFENGLLVSDYLWGGISGGEGVVLVIQSGDFAAGSAKGLFLNTAATPAIIGGTEIKSPDGLPITLVVPTVDSCFVAGTSPRVVSWTACNTPSGPATSHIKIDGSTGGAGGGPWINIGGVIWAPTDDVKIGSNYLEHDANVAQIWAWSVTYSGGATLNQVGTASEKAGPIRIDTACSPGEAQTTCN